MGSLTKSNNTWDFGWIFNFTYGHEREDLVDQICSDDGSSFYGYNLYESIGSATYVYCFFFFAAH